MGKFFTLFLRVPFFLSAGIIVFNFISAQEIPVLPSGSITAKNEPVPAASVTAIDRLDSLQRFPQVADSNGIAPFRLIKGHQYSDHHIIYQLYNQLKKE